MQIDEKGLIVLASSRVFEIVEVFLAIGLMLKGVAIRYVILIIGIALTFFMVSIFGFFMKLFPLGFSFVWDSLGFSLTLLVAYYSLRRMRLEPPPLPKGCRCAVCSAFIREDHAFAALKSGSIILFFDSEEHMKSFLENFEEYKKLRGLRIERVEWVYSRALGKWLSLEEYQRL
ncbi:hypothetical protein [Thermocrinis minervae]|uniref:Uncharacterized protein n=1 Tax=Thermocrinis minervae TaxID=381751 RepID=A0A1M6RXQ0_9AQUI|nr:hypothetical protein [Thermocrinis minervae]SHK37108.1 hypothetical protein SAMN05444391_0801 [Thermocrinis minervae]